MYIAIKQKYVRCIYSAHLFLPPLLYRRVPPRPLVGSSRAELSQAEPSPAELSPEVKTNLVTSGGMESKHTKTRCFIRFMPQWRPAVGRVTEFASGPWSDRPEPSRAKPSPAEPSPAQPRPAEPSRAEPSPAQHASWRRFSGVSGIPPLVAKHRCFSQDAYRYSAANQFGDQRFIREQFNY